MKILRFLVKTSNGQTAVEYVLMLAVGCSLGIGAFKKLNEYFIARPDSLIGKPLNSMKSRLQEGNRYTRAPFSVQK